MNQRKALKKRLRRKDYVKKKNIMKNEMNSVMSGEKKRFSVAFPISKKFSTKFNN